MAVSFNHVRNLRFFYKEVSLNRIAPFSKMPV